MNPTFETHYVTTNDELRALAHPLRLRLLGLLRADGPATASGLGKRVGESSGVTSYHLRYLADRNFVTEAPELGNKRERWWRAAQESTEWNSADFLDSREARAAELTIRRELLRVQRATVDNWTVEETTWSKKWVGASVASDLVLRLNAEQLVDFGEDYRDLAMKHIAVSAKNEEAARADAPEAAGLEQVIVYLHAFPVRDVSL